MLLPVANTTAEEIAAYIATELRDMLRPTVGDRIESLEVGVDENHGQWGSCKIEW
jgi:6-pyruvoyltetrahydropterin/6-carboxytetrahydropterin synthase